jgi:hypothetical protein
VFAVLELSFFAAGLVYIYVLGVLHHAPTDKQLELGFVLAFGIPVLAIVTFFTRAFVVSLRSLRTRKLGLRFDVDQVYIVDGDLLLAAELQTKRIRLLSDYLIVRAGEKRYWFSLLMAQE